MKKKALFTIALVCAAVQWAWAQNTYIECSWDGTNKQIVQTEKPIPEGAHNISDYTSGGEISDWIVVNQTMTINSALKCKGTVHMVLCDGVTLTLTQGIIVPYGYKLFIHSQSYDDTSMGKLVVSNSIEGVAGIGSEVNNLGGSVEVHGGYILATGGKDAAGIGCGKNADWDGFTIKGGKVVAYGGEGGAGIGGGTDDYYFYDRFGGYMYIFGGYVEGHGGDSAAGIGGGKGGNGGIVTVYGGTVRAWGGPRGAGIGSGEQKERERNGRELQVHGGDVWAKGGDYAAGIGGGQDASGAVVVVTDGTVYAYAGTDGAGIGSGEGATEDIHGGKLTVTGGFVFADGTGWGAGIGGGEDSDGSAVVVTGGTVIAWAGADAGDKSGSAIGSEDGDGHRGSLTIGEKMMVHAGQDPNSVSLFSAPERVPACYFRPYTRIEPCTHNNATYTVSGTTDTDTHTLHCKYCTYTPTDTHVFVNGTCSVCNVGATAYTVIIYLPKDETDTGAYEVGQTYQMVPGNTFDLPGCPQEVSGLEFDGWRVGTPDGLTTYVASDDETLLAEGTPYTISGTVSLTARYRPLPTTPTGISEAATVNDKGGEEWYTLDGRRLNAMPGEKGLYIRNGRKVVIR